MNSFYYPSLDSGDQIVELDGAEAKHMTAARRLKLKDKVTLFNGQGLLAMGWIESITSKNVRIKLTQINQLGLPQPGIILASAIPKGDRVNILLDMATQLGMTDFIPLDCERSVANQIEKKIQRYKRICISACKQSQRYYLPRIHAPMTPKQLIEESEWPNKLFILADPQADSEQENLIIGMNIENLILIVGPEGGFSNKEEQLFNRQKIKKLRLSEAILRIETACVSLLAKINYRQIG